MAASLSGMSLAIWMIVFTGVTTLVMALRLWAIHITRKGFQLSDYAILVAYVSACTMAALAWWAIANGLGSHTNELSDEEIGVQYKLIIASGMTWLVGTVCCKLSMLALYTTLFRAYKPIRILVWIVSGLVGAYFVAFLPIFLTQCHPISYGWDPVPGGGCRSLTLQEILSIVLNIVLDTIIALLPVPALWKLHMAIRNKVTIGAMFGMGLIVVAVMIWRLIITLDPDVNSDFVYGLSLIALVSFLELWLSMIIASLPALAPLFRRYIEPLFPSKRFNPNRPNLRAAERTIGSDPTRRPSGMQHRYGDPELGWSAGYYAKVVSGSRNSTQQSDDTNELVRNMQPNAIQMKREISVQAG
ncbi:uncharacterized protein ACLA_060120 [Aspergillus clavatus NRRL 1]|uniref:Rhodopsin domain-containing protein n=1 Tax=Aspergillus clavatus (strain ATCC 1007 / CBS 513.65 / DSM 816 / NCTC 3887 / NRRL 1 / QM 1276 / 107) TaxID=344612 RepID=A1C4K5_ASPCL|nr:uncharacterized protein ACLA_060120 [Aspergillus clavatus NRRL 1]EAW15345.1 hypothetical protein ACLA_060120 [Aspergillus clavatus NRRL 1]